MLRLITHTGYIINRNKCLRINFIDKLHQLLIFTFIYDGDDLTAFFHVIGSRRKMAESIIVIIGGIDVIIDASTGEVNDKPYINMP